MKEDREWIIKGENLLSKWANKVNPKAPLPEYPRPQMKRDNWLNLNGLWEYAIKHNIPKFNPVDLDGLDGTILVPYPVESALSGVKKRVSPKNCVIYRKKFIIPEEWDGKKILLHFGAVDWKSTIYINKKEIDTHIGGYLPFTVDISEALQEENELLVVVWDPTNRGNQQFGKQTLFPNTVFYTAVSGIWQTVWLEPVPERFISEVKLIPDIDNHALDVSVSVNPSPSSTISIKYEVLDDGKCISSGNSNGKLIFNIIMKNYEIWTPNNPHLYDLKLSIIDDGTITDTVVTYFGIRKISLKLDDDGQPRIALNDEIFFQFGPLDQGYWPDGLYTAPTDDALKFDIEIAKELGFNMIRKHIKIEPQRWYYWCDKLGMLVWQDMPNGGNTMASLVKTFLGSKGKRDVNINPGRKKQADKDIYYNELRDMIIALQNHPSIVVWVPFNEGWGQFKTSEVVNIIRELDNSRLIDAASGWIDEGLGDISDIHQYPGPGMPAADDKRAVVCGEFGGLLLKIPNHNWKSKMPFIIYKRLKDQDRLLQVYTTLMEKLEELKDQGLSAAVYTQIADVETELNGLLTYDREVIKLEMAQFKTLHEKIITNRR